MHKSLTALLLAAITVPLQSCASDQFAKLEGRLENRAIDLEQYALELQTLGAGISLVHTAEGQRYAQASAVVAEMQREAQRFFHARTKVEDKADELVQSLSSDPANSGPALERVTALQGELQASDVDLTAFGDATKARIKLVGNIMKEFVQARTPDKKKADETLDQLFTRLETSFPHSKKDIAKLQRKHGDEILSLTTGCELKEKGDCELTPQTDPAKALERLQSFRDLVNSLENDWGEEIGTEFHEFIAHHPEGLMLDLVAVASDHAQRLRSLHTKLEWVEDGLDAIAGERAKGDG